MSRSVIPTGKHYIIWTSSCFLRKSYLIGVFYEYQGSPVRVRVRQTNEIVFWSCELRFVTSYRLRTRSEHRIPPKHEFRTAGRAQKFFRTDLRQNSTKNDSIQISNRTAVVLNRSRNRQRVANRHWLISLVHIFFCTTFTQVLHKTTTTSQDQPRHQCCPVPGKDIVYLYQSADCCLLAG